MLGSVSEREDVVQEGFLRLHRACEGDERIESLTVARRDFPLPASRRRQSSTVMVPLVSSACASRRIRHLS
ncbi:MAG: hypothetical protein JO120_08760, partial [Solirubrobacterales bacterium]|nr:hypothetical protein [Solirubrobacterales bacterium]